MDPYPRNDHVYVSLTPPILLSRRGQHNPIDFSNDIRCVNATVVLGIGHVPRFAPILTGGAPVLRCHGPHLHLVPDRGQLDAVPGRRCGNATRRVDGSVPGRVGYGVLRSTAQPHVRQVVPRGAIGTVVLLGDGLVDRHHLACTAAETYGVRAGIAGGRRVELLIRGRVLQDRGKVADLARGVAYIRHIRQLVYIHGCIF